MYSVRGFFAVVVVVVVVQYLFAGKDLGALITLVQTLAAAPGNRGDCHSSHSVGVCVLGDMNACV